MTLRDLLIFLFKWKVTLLSVIVLVTGFVTLFVYLFPPGYSAQSALLIERTGGAMQFAYAPNQDMVEILNTEATIVTSRPVLEAVIDELGLAQPSAEDGTGLRGILAALGLSITAEPRERWIERLQRRVRAKPGTQSSVLTIHYNNTDPELAQAIVNAISRHYIDRHRQIFSNQGLSDFYRTRMSEVEQELADLRADLIARGGNDLLTGVALTGPAEITRLRVELAQRRTELRELQARFLPGYRLLRVAEEQVAALEEALADAESESRGASNTDPAVQQLLGRIENQERTLSNIKTRYEEAVLSERSQVNFVDVRLISPAAVPAKPNISRLFLILLAFASSLVLAAMIAIISEYFDDRVLNTEDVEEALGLRCHGTVS